MNVLIVNKYETMLDSLGLEIIKKEKGVFDADEIIKNYQNFYFQRMILDVTAIQGYRDIKNLQKLSIALDMDKIILLLDDSEESNSPEYLSQLISMGIYNFTKNAEGVMYLYHNPNSYRDVAHIHQLDHTTPVIVQEFVQGAGARIIGIKDIVSDSGATTLTYMMKKQLAKNYDVVAIEVDKNDFRYFMDKSLISTSSDGIGQVLAKNGTKDIILIDVNDSAAAMGLCQEILYLLEPSMIKLNRLMMTNPRIFSNYKNKKIILNQSLLSSKDVLDFEYEAKTKIFYNMPPLDEREKDIFALNAFLTRLGFTKQEEGETPQKKGFLDNLFGKKD